MPKSRSQVVLERAAFTAGFAWVFTFSCIHVWQTHALVNRVDEDRVDTSGVITHITGGRSPDYEIEFQDTGGQIQVVSFSSAWPFEPLDVGDTVGVAHSRSDPTQSYAIGHRYQISSFVYMVMPVVAAIVFWRFHRAPPGKHERR
jgi:hypothetical protein